MASDLDGTEAVLGKVPVLDVRLQNLSVVARRRTAAEDINAVSALFVPLQSLCAVPEAIFLLKDISVTFPAGQLTLVRPGTGRRSE
jgi:hypothetical protein